MSSQSEKAERFRAARQKDAAKGALLKEKSEHERQKAEALETEASKVAERQSSNS